MNFQGRTAIVTGGNGYIGGTISRKLLEQGASVAIFDIALENARKTAEEFENAYPVSVDLTNPDSVQAAVAGTIKHFGKADLLVTSAGGSARSRMKPFAEQDMNVIRGIIEMNLFGALHVIHAVVPHMFRQNYGRIVNLSSLVALGGVEGCADYAAARVESSPQPKHLQWSLDRITSISTAYAPAKCSAPARCPPIRKHSPANIHS